VASAVLKRAPAGAPIQWAELRRALTCWLAFVVAIALMPLWGFFVSLALLTWFIVAVLARKSQRVAITLALGGTAAFYAVFALALDLGLPRGLLF
jgi:hypothetical protein